MSDAYRTVTVTVRQVHNDSIRIDKPTAVGDAFIPRSLIHYADDKDLDTWPRGPINVDVTLRVREWKAEELGLAG